MSFDPIDRDNMRLCFPSKLTEYTAAGLPLLVYAPIYSSAARWVEENQLSAELVTEENPEKLDCAIDKLKLASYRNTLAINAFNAGNKYFSHKSAQDKFFSLLLNCEG